MLGLIGKLAGQGVMGLNERNCQYIMRYNPRRLYPLVDDKLATKRLAMAAGLPVPELYGVISSHREVRDLPTILAAHRDFVVKPAQGSGGDGILVVSARVKDRNVYRLVDGSIMGEDDIEHHLSNIISGQYSLGGHRDVALVEYCVKFDATFAEHSFRGVPDIRVIVFRGYPVMGMVRLPTRRSHGKANLHQGAGPPTGSPVTRPSRNTRIPAPPLAASRSRSGSTCSSSPPVATSSPASGIWAWTSCSTGTRGPCSWS
jgi:alpha-L-glutamate ligase-like protein